MNSPEHSFTMAPGEALIIASDGLTERSVAHRDELGLDGLIQLISAAGPTAEDMAAIVTAAGVHRHCSDDQTVLVLRAVP